MAVGRHPECPLRESNPGTRVAPRLTAPEDIPERRSVVVKGNGGWAEVVVCAPSSGLMERVDVVLVVSERSVRLAGLPDQLLVI